MHVAFGMLGFAAVLATTVLLEQKEATFSGLFYRPALLLLCVGPLFISLLSHKVDELAASARTLWRAVRFSAPRSRAVLQEEVSRFAAEVRRGRPVEALAIAEDARHDLVRQLAPLVVKQYSPEDIERTAATASTVLASAMKRSEDVLTSLARVAPAVGLVGTTLGLITLLSDLRNFEHLGPSMALALLCTLYGLVLVVAWRVAGNVASMPLIATEWPTSLLVWPVCIGAAFSVFYAVLRIHATLRAGGRA